MTILSVLTDCFSNFLKQHVLVFIFGANNLNISEFWTLNGVWGHDAVTKSHLKASLWVLSDDEEHFFIFLRPKQFIQRAVWGWKRRFFSSGASCLYNEENKLFSDQRKQLKTEETRQMFRFHEDFLSETEQMWADCSRRWWWWWSCGLQALRRNNADDEERTSASAAAR